MGTHLQYIKQNNLSNFHYMFPDVFTKVSNILQIIGKLSMNLQGTTSFRTIAHEGDCRYICHH